MVKKPTVSTKLSLPGAASKSDDPKTLRVRTNLHAGVQGNEKKNIADTVMFALLDALQKPTDCLYSVICKKSEE